MLEFLLVLTIAFVASVYTLIPPTYASEKDKTERENPVQRILLSLVPIYLLAFAGLITTYLYFALTNREARRPFASPDTKDVLALCLLIFGTGFRLWAMRILGHFHTFTITVRKSHSLITKGPYAYVRHPSYTGLTCIFISWALILGDGRFNYVLGAKSAMIDRIYQILYLIFAYTFLYLRMGREEKVLEREFGKQWTEFAAERKRLFPYVY